MNRLERTRRGDNGWLFMAKILGIAASSVIFLFLTFKTIHGSDAADKALKEQFLDQRKVMEHTLDQFREEILKNREMIIDEIRNGRSRHR